MPPISPLGISLPATFYILPYFLSFVNRKIKIYLSFFRVFSAKVCISSLENKYLRLQYWQTVSTNPSLFTGSVSSSSIGSVRSTRVKRSLLQLHAYPTLVSSSFSTWNPLSARWHTCSRASPLGPQGVTGYQLAQGRYREGNCHQAVK